MGTLRLSSAVIFTVAILCACGGGSGSPSTGPSADGGGLSDAGTIACVASLAGSCPGGGAFCGSFGCCPAGSGTFACNGKCYQTQAEAIAACGASCVACYTAGPADAGTDAGTGCAQSSCTCPAGAGPYACESTRTCYTTQAAAQAVCGSSCLICTGSPPDGGIDGGPATCSTAPPGTCSNSQFPLYCGGSVCCPADYPFDCASTGYCYKTQQAAAAACGNSCVACVASSGGDGGTDGGTNTCTPAPAGTCSNSSLLYCGGSFCCPAMFPFNCAGTHNCYQTEQMALADCPSNCNACQPSGGIDGGTDGGGPTCKEAPEGKCSQSGYGFCGGTDCCPNDFPYTCPSSPKCFRTPEEAIAGCGSDPCVHCH